MAGLLSGVLPYLYQQGDRAKRHVNSLLSDPLGVLEQTAGGLLDSHRAQQNLLAQAFADKGQPFKVTDANAMQAAAQNMLAGPLGFAPAGITAWHGSPHVFDKFDSSKIGTGEGAQAYGHGIYLAESPQTAEYYKSAVTSQRVGLGTMDGKPLAQLSPVEKQAVMDLKLAGGDVQKAIKQLSNPQPGYEASYAARRALLEEVAAGQRSAELAQGALYKVDLPDSAVARMLDWDRKLSEQAPEVRDVLNRVGRQPGPLGLDRVVDDMRGSDWGKLVNTPEGTQALRRAGIPGIRYLDGGSRGAGQGSSNFVVFPGEENMLKILERNGVPLGR